MDNKMKYYKLKHKRSGEVTSVCIRDDDWKDMPGVTLHPEGDYNNGFSCVETSFAEFETLLTLYDMKVSDVTPNNTDFWLFTGGVPKE